MSKTRIFLAGDSTVQSYPKEKEPQTGWGQVWWEYFQGAEQCVSYPSDSVFSQAVCYELADVIIDNRAMAGRSSRSFREEGRLSDIAKAVGEGDYLLAQFGHNDANQAKEERYVRPEDFGASLAPFAELCAQKGAVFILVTPIAMRNCEDNPEGKFTYSFPEYREAMIRYAKEAGLPLLDLGKATTEYCGKLGAEECKKLFLWVKPGEYPDSECADGRQDNAHLQLAGARVFAGVLTELIQNDNQDSQLDALRSWLRR
ncbi:MAG: rhamnogalacturonan acetylesterase [Lachnospiraceae bacterium]|nr:rhamnogalacturonan acetylesterase [Lachnospiraceae bacterium]